MCNNHHNNASVSQPQSAPMAMMTKKDNDGLSKSHHHRSWHIWWTVLLISVFVILAGYALHRPLPAGFAERTKMQVIEPFMRITYYYPSRMFNSARFMLTWTRLSLGWFASILNPWSLYDPHINISDRVFDGVTARVYEPKNNRSSDGAVIFIHGGGYVVGSIDMYESLTRQMSRQFNMVLLSVEYRLAPEHPFPAGMEDCERLIINFLRHSHRDYNVDPNKVVIMGDSAGGGLAAVMAQRFSERSDLPSLKLQVLIYPLLQFASLRTPSYQYYYEHMAGTMFLDPASIASYYMMYAGINIDDHPEYPLAAINNRHVSANDRQRMAKYVGNHRLPEEFLQDKFVDVEPDDHHEAANNAIAPFLLNPDFSPLMRDNLAALPKTYVMTCKFDILRDDGKSGRVLFVMLGAMYVDRLREQGVPVTWQHYDSGFHGMFNFYMEVQLAQEALARIATWILAHL